MKAMYCPKYGGPEVYQYIDIDKPKPLEHQILVEVYRSVVSPTDANFRSGKPFIARLFSGLLKPKKAIHGEMFVGKVTAVGTSVTTFKVNDFVYGSNGMKLGAYAEYMVVNDSETIKVVPNDIAIEDALPLLDGGITALPFLKELAKAKEKDSVLINGASGAVGSMAVMIAKHLGCHVSGVCSTKNMDTVKKLGADEVIDYTKEDFTKNKNTYDIIFDTVGKASYSNAKHALTANGIFVTTVPTPDIMLQALFKKKSNKKRASFMAAGLRKPTQKISDLEYLEELIRNKELTPLHGKEYPLHQLGDAQSYVETGHKVGNVVVIVKQQETVS